MRIINLWIGWSLPPMPYLSAPPLGGLTAKATTSSEYFLGGNAMPTWMVAVSVLATSQSAATFIGGPDQGYQGDLSYLATNIGAFIAAVIVAKVLIPRFYRYRVYTVYELLEQQIGPKAKRSAGLMYLFGRVFASGARLYMAAIAVAMILYGNIAASSVIMATLVLVLVGLLYTVFGGIRTVIYSDVIQCAVYTGAALMRHCKSMAGDPGRLQHCD